MKLCILGNGLVSLSLAKALVNEGIFVDVITTQKNLKYDKSRTLGISKSNIEFFNKNILNIEKLIWNINKIEIFSENHQNKKILNFENEKKTLFSIIKNHNLYEKLILNLKKKKYFQFKKKINIKDYKLVINCENKSEITKKFFFKRFNKDYNSYAHIALIDHKKINNNFTAYQIFTKKGPLAFLPINKKKTSVVFSVKGKKDIDLKNLIKKYNIFYDITHINKSSSFELKSSILRTYYYKNILAFGDLLHKIHPLAGQGFNMSIRDIEELLELIKNKKNNGLDLDSSICADFENKIKHKNYLFSKGVDFIYELFNLESKVNTNLISKSISTLGKNKNFGKLFTKFADKGLFN